MQVKIILHSLDEAQKFVSDISTLDSEVDLSVGSYSVDAKSLLGIYTIGLSTECIATLHSDNELEIQNFTLLMNNYLS